MEHKIVFICNYSLCLICLLILFIKHLRSINFKINSLSCGYIFTMSATISSILWIIADGNPDLIPLNYIANLGECFFLSIIGYTWFIYCTDIFEFPFFKKRSVRIIFLIPTVISSILLFTTPLHHWLFSISEDGFYTRGKFLFIQRIGYLYLFLCSVLAVISYRREPLTRIKRRYKCMAMFSGPPLFLGLFQILSPVGLMPTIHVSVFISLLLVHLEEQDQHVTRDFLTNLSNKFEFERVLNEKIIRYRTNAEKRLFLFIGDIDDLKIINDTFGHLAGDEVIKAVGCALESICEYQKAMPFHLSGDEFAVIYECGKDENPENFLDMLSEEIVSEKTDNKISAYISFGQSEYKGNLDFKEFINETDRKMYEEKKRKKTLNTVSI